MLNSHRFDVIFKYIYVKYSILYKNFDNWTKDLYKQHIQLFNGEYENDTMYQEEEKHGISAFFKKFKLLINSFFKKYI